MKAAALCALAVLSVLSAWAEPLQLTYFEWEGYLSPFEQQFEAYAKTRGFEVDLVLHSKNNKPWYIADPEEIFSQVRLEVVDIVTPTHNYYKMGGGRLLHLLHPLDESKIPNLAHVHQSLKNAGYARDEEGLKAVPLLGGCYGLAYRVDAGITPPTSWADLLKPESRGTYSVTASQFEANIYQMALLAGVPQEHIYDFDKITPEQRKKIVEYTTQLVINAESFWEGMPYPEDIQRLSYVSDNAFGVSAAKKAGQRWQFVHPVEGETTWMDNLSMTRTCAKNPQKLEVAYLLLDFYLSPEIQAKLQSTYDIISPCMNQEMQHLDSGTLWRPLTDRTRNQYKRIWDEAVAARMKQLKK